MQPFNQYSPLNALAHIQQQGEIGRERGQQNQLNQLASMSYGANTPEQRQQLLTNTAVISRQAAQQQEKAFEYTDERRNLTMLNMAKLLTGAPEQARPGLYRQMVPTLSKFNLSELPLEYDAQSAPMINETAQALIRAYDGSGASGTLQSQRVLDDGSILNTYRNGRTENTGLKADRQAWFRDQPGFEPEIISKDGTTRQIGGPSTVGAMAAPGQGIVVGNGAGALRMNIEGISPQQQQRMAQTASMMQQAGYPEQEVMAFLQSQLPPEVPGAPPAGSQGAAPQSRARPSAAEEAAQVEEAKRSVEMRFLPNELGMRNDAEIDRVRREAEAKAAAERAGKQAGRTTDATDTLDLLTQAESLLNNGATGGLLAAGGDRAAALFNRSTEGARATASLQTIAGQLTSKMPRMEGPQSNVDVKLYQQMAGDLANDTLPVQTRMAALQQLRQLQQKYTSDQGPPGNASPSTRRTVTRSGIYNGRRVIQYSDGSTEYGD